MSASGRSRDSLLSFLAEGEVCRFRPYTVPTQRPPECRRLDRRTGGEVAGKSGRHSSLLTGSQLRAIGVVVVEASALEHTLEQMIWTASGLQDDTGRIFTERLSF